MRVVLYWESGAYLSTADHEYEKHLNELTEQYGPPAIAIVRDEDEWSTH